MGKAINALVNKQDTESEGFNPNVVKLHVLDFNHKLGGYEKIVVKKPKRDPRNMLIQEVREVTYLYDKKTTKGWEIVKEYSASQDEFEFCCRLAPKVVGSVTRDCRNPNYVPERTYVQEEV